MGTRQGKQHFRVLGERSKQLQTANTRAASGARRRATLQQSRRSLQHGASSAGQCLDSDCSADASPQLPHKALRHAAEHHGGIVVRGHGAVHAKLQHHLLLRQRHACSRCGEEEGKAKEEKR